MRWGRKLCSKPEMAKDWNIIVKFRHPKNQEPSTDNSKARRSIKKETKINFVYFSFSLRILGMDVV